MSHQAAASTVRCWCRDSSSTDFTIPLTDSSRWSIRNASVASGACRPVTGSRNQSGSATSGRRVPSTSQSPTTRRWAAATRRCAAAGARCARAAIATGLAISRRGSRAPTGSHASPGRIWRPAQRTCLSWLLMGAITSSADVQRSRWTHHRTERPTRPPAWRRPGAHPQTVPGCADDRAGIRLVGLDRRHRVLLRPGRRGDERAQGDSPHR